MTVFNPHEPRSSPHIFEKPGTIPPLRPWRPQSCSRTSTTVRESPSWNVGGKGSFDRYDDVLLALIELEDGTITGIGCDEGEKTGTEVDEGDSVVENRSIDPCKGDKV